MGTCNDVYMGVRVFENFGWCDISCSRDAIQVVSVREMVRLAQGICTMSALVRSIQGVTIFSLALSRFRACLHV